MIMPFPASRNLPLLLLLGSDLEEVGAAVVNVVGLVGLVRLGVIGRGVRRGAGRQGGEGRRGPAAHAQPLAEHAGVDTAAAHPQYVLQLLKKNTLCIV